MTHTSEEEKIVSNSSNSVAPEMPFKCRLCTLVGLKNEKKKATCKVEGSQIAPPPTCRGLESCCYKPSNKSGTFSQITILDWIMKNNLLVCTTQRVTLGMTRTLTNLVTDTQFRKCPILCCLPLH